MSRKSNRLHSTTTDNTERLKGSFQSIHGFRGSSIWVSPKLVSKSFEASRADQGNTIESSEYMDEDHVLNEKIDLLIELLKKSKCSVAYTGAGLSRASGIGDYASKSNSINSNIPKLKSVYDALPTLSHKVLTSIEKEGYLHHWVQQNHDGLPQKAGFPQEKINEIHGAWYCVDNPVVQFNENLRGDLYAWMKEIEKKTDLCLCLGTSLSGMNADRMAHTPATKSMSSRSNTIGTVIINLQRTNLDSKCCLRIWAKLDDVFNIIASKMNLSINTISIDPPSNFNDQFIIPYNKHGKYDLNSRMVWDLRINQKIIICNPEASNYKKKGKIYKKDNQNNYIVLLGNTYYRLGKWWPVCLMNGKWPFHIPIINLNPKFKEKEIEIIDLEMEDVSPNDKDECDITDKDNTIVVSDCFKLYQTHTELSDNSNEWSLYFDDNFSNSIHQVTYILHHTFNPSEITVQEYPFLLTRIGWGTFNIKIIIQFKNSTTKQINHELQFNNTLNSTSISYK